MGQLLLELGSIPEPKSSSPHLHAMGRKRMDPDTRASLLTVALLHMPPPKGAGPQTGGGTNITWKCIGADEDIPLMRQPNRDSAIASATIILHKRLQFYATTTHPSNSHAQRAISSAAVGIRGGASSTPAGGLPRGLPRIPTGIPPPSSPGQLVATAGGPSRAHGDPGGKPTHILLCNQSTIDVIYNPDLLTGIQTASQPTTVKGLEDAFSARVVKTTGHLEHYGWMWHNPGGSTNTLALSRVRETYRVTYDLGLGDDEDVFGVHTVRGPLRFGASLEGLYSATAASLAALSLTPVPPWGQPSAESARRPVT